MLREWRAFLAALGALTRLHAPGGVSAAQGRASTAAWPAEGLRHFPAAGLCIGAFSAVVLWLAAHAWPALLAVLLAMAASAWLTRAMHERGLAAGSDALTLLFVLALKAAALQGLAVRDLEAALMLLPLAHTWSRAAGVFVLRLPGLAGAPRVDGHTLAVALMWAGVMAVAAVPFVAGQLLVLAALAAVASAALAGRWLQRRGAATVANAPGGVQAAAAFSVVQQASELAVLLAVLAGMARG
jgi:adenosylcobinamide-GDP ribazoletransferase